MGLWRRKPPRDPKPATEDPAQAAEPIPHQVFPYVSGEARLALGLFGSENMPSALRPDGAPDEAKDRIFDDEL